MLEPERDDGNVEYKLKLTEKSKERIDKLTTQIRYRVEEGHGECIYKVGIKDCGEKIGISEEEYTETMLLIDQIARQNRYTISSIYEQEIEKGKKIYELLIREHNENRYIELKVAVSGNVDSGKSTTIGTLITGKLDDGRGSARLNVFNYPHEVQSGRTSSIGHQILGFSTKGDITNYATMGKKTWPEIVKDSQKIVSFSDLAGHSKYLKTTILGLSSSFPDLSLVTVGANMGLMNMTKEHIYLCLSLKIPFVIVITKIDICKDRMNVYEDTVQAVNKFLKQSNIRRIPYKVKSKEDLLLCAEKMYSNAFTPIFHTSNVTGEGIDLLKEFLNVLPKRDREYDSQGNMEYHIDTVFTKIKGTSLVVGGNLISGSVKVGDKLLIGPINDEFHPVFVRSIHCKKVPLNEVNHSTYVCIGLKGIDKDVVRRGHILASINAQPQCIRDFDVEMQVLKTHSTTIRPGYEPILHTCSIRQSAALKQVLSKTSARDEVGKDDILRMGDRGICRFHFKYRGEFIKEGYRIFLNEGHTKAIGVVRKVY
jgi:GTPase